MKNLLFLLLIFANLALADAHLVKVNDSFYPIKNCAIYTESAIETRIMLGWEEGHGGAAYLTTHDEYGIEIYDKLGVYDAEVVKNMIFRRYNDLKSAKRK